MVHRYESIRPWTACGVIGRELGTDLALYHSAVVTDFPMFEWNANELRLEALHHEKRLVIKSTRLCHGIIHKPPSLIN